MSNKPKKKTQKRKKDRRDKDILKKLSGIFIIIIVVITILACGNCECQEYDYETDTYKCIECPDDCYNEDGWSCIYK